VATQTYAQGPTRMDIVPLGPIFSFFFVSFFKPCHTYRSSSELKYNIVVQLSHLLDAEPVRISVFSLFILGLTE
jgi:1,4-dihydroxy-2-naphthoate octaprenyltransferase